MIVALARGTTAEQAEQVIGALRGYGAHARLLDDPDEPLLHLYEGPTRAARAALEFEWVIGLVPTSGPRIRREGRRFYPYHFINWSTAALLLLGVLVVLSGFFPPGGVQAIDPAAAPAELSLPWYMRAPTSFFAMFAGLPGWMVWTCVLVLLVLVFFAPRIDHFLRRWVHGLWLLRLLGLLAALAWIALTVKGWVF